MKTRTVIFDIDGTLVLTGGAGLRALETVFTRLSGAPFSLDTYEPHGKTDGLIFEEIYSSLFGRAPSSDEFSRMSREYLEELPGEIERSRKSYRVLPGVPPLLDELERRGIPLGLGTGNLAEAARRKLDPGGLTERFAFGGYGCDGRDRSAVLGKALERAAPLCGKLDPREAVFIGDTRRDIEAVRSIGSRILAVATGPTPVEELSDADCAVSSLEDPEALRYILDLSGNR